MKVGGLLTSAGINIGLCVLFLSLYSILRKQPQNVKVYFGRRIAEEHNQLREAFILERFVPSTSWIVKSLRCTEDEILATAGLDAVVFNRILVFSIRIFSLAAILCVFGVLPLNYFGQDMHHVWIPAASLETFTIGNVQERSRWLWVHCVILYIISVAACLLLYLEYKHIARLRLCHVSRATSNPSHFTVLVRGIPKSSKESFSSTVESFFTKYHASSYLSHQVVYKVGKVQKIVSGAKKAYRKFKHFKGATVDQKCRPITFRCCFCGASSNSFQLLPIEKESEKPDVNDSSLSLPDEVCGAAFVFFKTRYAALIVAEILQTSNPMRWVTSLAPEPDDIYWSNLWLPYKQLWIRHIATLLGSIVFMFLFLIPVTFIQGLTQLEQLQQRLPFLRGILKKKYMTELITGYLPSVILQIFLYTVPPTMMLFSTLEGPISHSERKRSACCKVLYFTVWNVFFVNVLSGSAISQLNALSSPKDIPMQLARAVPVQATFFTTYVLTSGWASLSSELMQLFGLIWNFIRRYILRIKEDSDFVFSFPYHTEVPKILLFGLLGFTCSVLAPLILPFLLLYFFLAYVVYRNQFLNVYCTKYDTGGLYWPIAHNTTIFSIVLTQIICLGVFGLKESPVAAGFTIPLIILTLLFNQYCRKRLLPLFKTFPAQDLIVMDREDQQAGRMEDLHQRLHAAYFQFPDTDDIPLEGVHTIGKDEDGSGTSGESSCKESADQSSSDLSHPTLEGLPVSQLRNAARSLSFIMRLQKRGLSA
ncbi:CSC1-like protein RXW8 [Phragmites australis]|uniref:CSC1-like protein RXW8 n=1 Tax=Phragmites australis TaxID=29695 RepID=UPI002D7A232B|nr:CSC1-like protein RXW8 [Phragmites australis]XP_062214991.1 CSC1-like protein RXW8 [Phragmites australis]XP_062214993.1 CSC1-like protein RXW8 [Phragmites australis]